MKILLNAPLFLNEQGRRKNNEDYVFPREQQWNHDNDRGLFIVCDGVGGTAKGEVASRLVCESLFDFLQGRDKLTADDINKGIEIAESKIDAYVDNNTEAKGMATTLTLLAFDSYGATVAHVGDSRVYQIRNGEIIYKTWDHSFVNELVAKNLINESEAANHPQRNVVTKAIMGQQQPNVADVKLLTDVVAGDYFFLCSDGILESVSDEELTRLLEDSNRSNKEKLQIIKSKCEQQSKDNFSAYLVQVEKVIGGASVENKDAVFPFGKFALGLIAISLVFIGANLFKTYNEKTEAKKIESKIESSMEMLGALDTNEVLLKKNISTGLEEASEIIDEPKPVLKKKNEKQIRKKTIKKSNLKPEMDATKIKNESELKAKETVFSGINKVVPIQKIDSISNEKDTLLTKQVDSVKIENGINKLKTNDSLFLKNRTESDSLKLNRQ